jgi:hypothetical protein
MGMTFDPRKALASDIDNDSQHYLQVRPSRMSHVSGIWMFGGKNGGAKP